jgi:hypothetical protein
VPCGPDDSSFVASTKFVLPGKARLVTLWPGSEPVDWGLELGARGGSCLPQRDLKVMSKSSVLTLKSQLEALATDFLLWPKRGASGTLEEVNNASAGQEREPAIVLDHPALNHDDRGSIVTREPGDANHALGQTVIGQCSEFGGTERCISTKRLCKKRCQASIARCMVRLDTDSEPAPYWALPVGLAPSRERRSGPR